MDPQQVQFLDVSAKWNKFCLTPFGLGNIKEIGRKDNNVRYVVSPFRMIYSILLGIVYSVLFYIHVTYFRYDSSQGVLNVFLYYSGFVFAILIIFANLIQTKDTCALVTKMIYCELRFYKSNGEIISKRSRTLIAGFSLTITLSVAYDVFLFYLQNANIDFVFVLFSSYVYVLYNYLAIMHFSILQFWLQSSFYRINEGVIYFCKMAVDSTHKIHKIDFSIGDSTKTPRTAYDDKILFSRKPSNKKLIAKEIKKLRTLYNQVYNLSGQTNQAFANKNLIIVAANFLMTILVLFNTITSISKYSKYPEFENGIEMGSNVNAVFLTISTIFSLIWSCENTCEEANKTSGIIQDNLIHVNDPDTEKELKDFANQLLHEKVYFSPHGFFVLENGMLLSMLAAVASYLVILLQFK